MKNDSFGDRMKMYEGEEAGRRFQPCVPIAARLDGKTFSKFTRGLDRPYDKRLSDLMIATMTYLVKQTNARVGYTQSDEITLIYYSADPKSQVYLDGRIQKMTSILASMATSYFVHHLGRALPEKAGALPMFDCRVWALPDMNEAANTVLWRVRDAIRNSVSMAAQANFSHRDLQGKSQSRMLAMLRDKGIDWSDYPNFFKWGTLVRQRKVHRPFTAEEIEDLPPKHNARSNPNLGVERTETQTLSVCFNDLVNRSDFILGADEILV